MEPVVLKPLYHQNSECIGIYAEPCRLPSGIPLNYYFQKKAGARWSSTNKCWYMPCTEKYYETLANVLKGVAPLNVIELKKYLLERKRGHTSNTAVDIKARPITKSEHNYPSALKSLQPRINTIKKLSPENNEALQKFRQQLVLKSYSPSTLKTYVSEFSQFLRIIKSWPATDLTTSRIKDYLQYCHEKLHLSENTLHSRMNALKFYYEQVLGREKFFWEIPRPKKKIQLPKVLSESELERMFRAITNLKHKAILFTAYHAG